jgi:hypothetical protein
LATDATGRDTPLAVACATTVRCVATGIDGFTQPTVSYSRDGGRLWSTPITISSDAAGGEFMPGLSCASVTQCVAVGHDEATQGVALSISFEATVYFASHGGQGFMRPQSAWTRTHLHAATFTRSGTRGSTPFATTSISTRYGARPRSATAITHRGNRSPHPRGTTMKIGSFCSNVPLSQ